MTLPTWLKTGFNRAWNTLAVVAGLAFAARAIWLGEAGALFFGFVFGVGASLAAASYAIRRGWTIYQIKPPWSAPMKDFDPATAHPDQVRWFSSLGACRCGKPATGTLMGQRNEIYAASCLRCAVKRLARAKAEREAAEAYRLAQPA